jgi:hypothetical protein
MTVALNHVRVVISLFFLKSNNFSSKRISTNERVSATFVTSINSSGQQLSSLEMASTPEDWRSRMILSTQAQFYYRALLPTEDVYYTLP